ncbi:MAG: outer membrane beta-barrel protein [Bacteroidetes bacterium]|nr:outer membrane beta-barrel protein [Bacteroidota bacterium]
MQDNRLQIDKKFTDRAWGEMSKMLDGEMPSAPKRRRYPVWWWLPALLVAALLAGGAAYWFFSKQPAAKLRPDMPVAGALPSVRTAPGNTADFQETAGGAQQPTVGPGSATASSNQPSSSQSGNFFSSKNQVKNAPSALKNQPPGQSSPAFSEQSKVEGKITVPLETLPPVEGREATAVPGKLTSAEFSLLVFAEKTQPEVASKLPKPASVRWSFEGSGLSALTSPATGFSGEMIASKSLKNSRLSIESGVGYTFVQQPLSVLIENNAVVGPTTEINENSLIEYTTKSPGAPGFDAQSNSPSQTWISQGLNLHYASVPVQAAYWIGSRFTVHSGIRAGLLLDSRSDYTDSGILKSFSNSEQAADDNNPRTPFKVSTLDFAAVSGFRYMVSQRLSLGVQYQFGLTDVLPENKNGDFNRLFHFSLRYNLTGVQ